MLGKPENVRFLQLVLLQGKSSSPSDITADGRGSVSLHTPEGGRGGGGRGLNPGHTAPRKGMKGGGDNHNK